MKKEGIIRRKFIYIPFSEINSKDSIYWNLDIYKCRLLSVVISITLLGPNGNKLHKQFVDPPK